MVFLNSVTLERKRVVGIENKSTSIEVLLFMNYIGFIYPLVPKARSYPCP